MDMNLHLHRVLGLYRTRAAADAVVAQLTRHGIPQDKVDLHEPGHPTASPPAVAGSDDVLENVLKDGAIGTVAGSIAGAIGSVAMAAASTSLLVTSPLLAPLVMVGWGAGIGGLVGAVIGESMGQSFPLPGSTS